MKEVSMLELRQNAARVIKTLRQGSAMRLTYRGEAVAVLNPISRRIVPADSDPLYTLADSASDAEGLSNEAIDKLVYDL